MDAPIGSWWHVQQEVASEALILHVHGEVDLATAPKFEQLLADLPHDGPVVIDLAQVEYFDLAGVRALENLYARRSASARRIIVAGPQPQVRRVLDFAGLGQRFRIVGTVAQALDLLHITPPGVSAD